MIAAPRQEHHRFSKRVTATKRWQVLRMEILERDGFRCKDCGARGRLEVDHIKPVRTNPELAYSPDNLQALCPSCHTKKTRIECGHPPTRKGCNEWLKAVDALSHGATDAGGFSIPFGIKPSRVPVTIVCGPPGSGKTTYARIHAKPQDVIIDLDDYLKSVGGVSWDQNPEKVRAAFKLRDAAILGLAEQRRGAAWLIVTAPSAAERVEWARGLVRTRITMLAVDADTCKARIRADPDWQHAVEPMCTGVDRWWRIYSTDGGLTPKHKEIKNA